MQLSDHCFSNLSQLQEIQGNLLARFIRYVRRRSQGILVKLYMEGKHQC